MSVGRLNHKIEAVHRDKSKLVLTPRERQILRVKAGPGGTCAQVGAMLGIAPDTVKNTLASIRQKLRARDTAHAMAIAHQRGLI